MRIADPAARLDKFRPTLAISKIPTSKLPQKEELHIATATYPLNLNRLPSPFKFFGFWIVVVLTFFTVMTSCHAYEGVPDPEIDELSALKTRAEKGDAWSQYRLGLMHARGEILGSRNLKTARTWYEKSAAQNYIPAVTELAIYRYMGEGGPKDEDAAILELTKAADANFGRAMTLLGSIYFKRKEYPTSIAWYEKAVALGVTESMVVLADKYATGDGITKNCDKAHDLLQRAINAGDKGAIDKRNFYFEKAPDSPSVTFRAKGITGGPVTIDLSGASSECGTPGAGGKVEFDIGERGFQNFDATVDTKGGTSGRK